MNTVVGTCTGSGLSLPKGTEPMKFTREFMVAAGITPVIHADLSQVERKLAEELCQKQDQRVMEVLASP